MSAPPNRPVFAGLTSAYPRSEELVRATRDLDRGRAGAGAVETLYAASEKEVAALEERLFTTITGGYLRWNDLFRPIAESWTGFSVGPLTRWLETNTFFRQPVLAQPPVRVPGTVAARLPPVLGQRPEKARVLLPGPYTLARVLDNRTGESDGAVVARLGALYAEELAELRALGFGTFQFTDPYLVREPPDGVLETATLDAYRTIDAARGSSTTIVWTYGADPTPALRTLDRLPASVIGIDLTEVEAASLPAGPEGVGLGLGIIDPRTTLPENPVETVKVVREAVRRRRPSSVWLGPAASLDLLPTKPAEQKLLRLADILQALRREGVA